MAKRGELSGTRSDNKRSKSGGMDIIGATFSAEVQLVQKQLTALGYNPGPADGLYGEKTRQAVIAFQKKEGLTADGVVGAKTKAKLAEKSGGTASTLVSQNPGVSSDVLSQLQKDIDSYVAPSVPLTPTTDFPGVPGGGWTTPAVPGGASTLPALPAVPGVAQPGIAPVPQVQPGLQPGAQQAQVPVDDKIFGLPRKVVIGGGIAAGSLALIGILYALLRKKEDDAPTLRTGSLAERYESYTDRDGEQWGMRDGIVFRPSMSLSERVRRAPSQHRYR